MKGLGAFGSGLPARAFRIARLGHFRFVVHDKRVNGDLSIFRVRLHLELIDQHAAHHLQSDAEGRRKLASVYHNGAAFPRSRQFGDDVPPLGVSGFGEPDHHIVCDIGRNLQSHGDQFAQSAASVHLQAAGVQNASEWAAIRIRWFDGCDFKSRR